MGRRRRDRTRSHTGAGLAVAGRFGRRSGPRIRHGHTVVRSQGVPAPRGQVASDLGRPRHPRRRHRLRAGLADRVGLSPDGQALASRPAAVRGRHTVHRDAGGRSRYGRGGPHPGLRTHSDLPRDRLLQRPGLSTAFRRTGAYRRTHRRHAVGAPGLAADRVAQRLAHRCRIPRGRFATCRELRTVH